MMEPKVGVPPQLPVKPRTPAIVNGAIALLMACALAWLVVFGLYAAAAPEAGVAGPPPNLFHLDLVYILLIALAWARADTRAWLAGTLALFALLLLGVPVWTVIDGGDFAPGGARVVLASLGLAAFATAGTWLLYRPPASTYFAELKAFRSQVKAAHPRR